MPVHRQPAAALRATAPPGTQPGTFDAARLYDPSVGYQNAPGLAAGVVRQPAAQARSAARSWRSASRRRCSAAAPTSSYTHYDRNDQATRSSTRRSRRRSGFPGSQVVNIGRVNGWGDELAVNVRVLAGRRVRVGDRHAVRHERQPHRGHGRHVTFLTVGGGGQAQNRVGFCIADIFMYKVRSADARRDRRRDLTSHLRRRHGRVGPRDGRRADVPCATAPRVFWGHTQPTWQFGVNTHRHAVPEPAPLRARRRQRRPRAVEHRDPRRCTTRAPR